MVTAELNTHENLVLTYQEVPLKRVEAFKYLGLMFTGFPGMATIVVRVHMPLLDCSWKAYLAHNTGIP